MSESPQNPSPQREVIAPRQESLRAEFDMEDGSPEPAYGEVRLWTVARDPRSIFAYWVFNPSEHPEARGDDGLSRFILRITRDDGTVEATAEIQLETGNLFVPVSQPHCGYIAELGFFSKGVWCFLARSANTRTPPEVVVDDDKEQFATIPAKVTLGEIRNLLATSALPGEGIAETASRVQATAREEGLWTAEQEHLLAQLLGEESAHASATGASSDDLTRRLRRRLITAKEAAARSEEIPELWGEAGIGSPGASWPGSPGASWKGAPEGMAERGFFLHVNAELIFYGGTDPSAEVTVNGEAAELRHDGTFRFHFRLPDGEFEIPIVARSADGKEIRSATLRFARTTARAGDVGATAQPDFLPGMIGKKR